MGTKKEKKSKKATQKSEQETKEPAFPIIGLGASAGGLKALTEFFSAVPEETGMAFIVVVHMSPDQPSMLHSLIQKVTSVPVTVAQDGQSVEPGTIYIIPPDRELTVFNGTIQLMEFLKKEVHHPIDSFLRSLGQDHGERTAAIILSGTGTDGSLGLKEIKAHGGLVMVQSEDSADYDGMPRSALDTGLVDLALLPGEMPARLTRYFAQSKPAVAEQDPSASTDIERKWLNKIFAILRVQIGHDFSVYKLNTIQRRIVRRMNLNQIGSYESYMPYLRENPAETEALFRELLIGVTNFFRDPVSFDVLKTTVLPDLLKNIPEHGTFRVWIPGCSTGEEVYSMAIIIREYLDAHPLQISLQLFGTDIDNFAIDKAREGLYPGSIATDVGEERLKRYFVKEGDHYRIRKEIRDIVVFSVQDILKDPPFSRLNMLCCRNLLIYLDGSAQKKVLPLFHYTLKPEGVLVLGSSETIGGFAQLFDIVDRKWKIYRRRDLPHSYRNMLEFPSGISTVADTSPATRKSLPVTIPGDISQITQKAILDTFGPTALLIDSSGGILHIQGRTGKYLEALSGPPTQNILNLAREGLRIELSAAIRMARNSQEPVSRKNIKVRTNGDFQTINLHLYPLQTPRELAGRLLVVFEDIEHPDTGSDPGTSPDGSTQVSKKILELEQELQFTRESLQTTIEELESSNEELKSTNEEMQSSNEELQSTNEELESSKEELQSLNEEMQTVNAELQNNLENLSAAQDDMRNLLNSTEIATIFVDNDLNVRRFTEEATELVNLILTDVGRPLQHVSTNISYDAMIQDVRGVLKDLTPRETEVQTEEGSWYKMRILPYRTIDNRIDGCVLTFSSIDTQMESRKTVEKESRDFEIAWQLVRSIFDMNEDPLSVLDLNGNVVMSNPAFSTLLNVSEKESQGAELSGTSFNIPDSVHLKHLLDEAVKNKEDFTTETFSLISGKRSQRFRMHGTIIKKDKKTPYHILIRFLQEE